MEQEIMQKLNEIEYGFPAQDGTNIYDNPQKWDEEFSNFYYLLPPQELLQKKYGVCFDQVELERYLFEEHHISVKTYFICTYDIDNLPSHTFLVYENNHKYYWFEHSWATYRGIHEYPDLKSLLLDVKTKFINSHETNPEVYTFVYEYKKPPYYLSCDEFYKYCENSQLIKLNAPLYFYHLVPKKVSLNTGLLSLKYMYDHNMNDYFDKYTAKYLERITNSWNIPVYHHRRPDTLTREEIIDALNIFRGPYGASYIYFFKFPPTADLGPKMATDLATKDIYRLNINDEEVEKSIIDIFYGYENSHSDNTKLTKKYYETVTPEAYFKNYDDNLPLNYASLNHIAIAFANDYCPLKFLEKVS